MLNPPSGTSKADVISAIKADAATHVRFRSSSNSAPVLSDADFHSDGLVLRSYFNSDVDLNIGKTVKKELAFKVLNTQNVIDFPFSVQFTMDVGVDINGSTVWIIIGKFTCIDDDRYEEGDVKEFLAYDDMSKFDIPAEEWLKNRTYPTTVSNMFASLCSYVGLTGSIGDALSNMKDRVITEAPIQNMGLMCRDVLELIAEACGCYAVIDSANNCRLTWYKAADYTSGNNSYIYTLNNNDIFSRRDKDYISSVEGLNVKQTEDDTGVLYPSTATQKIYVIVDNPFLVTANSAEEDDYIVPLYNRLVQANHYPAEATCLGNPLIEAGDMIYVHTPNGGIRWIPIYVKEMYWNGALTDTYLSSGSLKRQSYTSAIKQKLSQGGRYHIFKNTVDQLYSELYDPTTGDISVLDQRATALELSVADKYSIVSGIGITSAGVEVTGSKYVKIISGGSFLVDATNFKIDSTNRIFQTGNWKMTADELEFNHDLYSIDFGIGHDVVNTHRMGIDVTGVNQIYIFNHDHLSLFDHSVYGVSYGWYAYTDQFDVDREYIRLWFNGYLGWQTEYISRAYITDIYGTLHSASSREKKHDIEEIPDMGEAIDRCTPVSFAYNDDESEKTHYGLIYEDTEDIVPVVCENTDGLKNINYVELVPVLLKEIQSLRKRVASLENPTN